MKFRLSLIALALAVSFGAAACGDDDNPGGPSGNLPPKFTATLNQANEFPAISNADGTATGTATITFNLTKDAAGNITSATADFSVPMTGYPPNTALTLAHIHTGAAGTMGSPIVNLALSPGEFVANASGAVTLTKTVTVPPTDAQTIINNPAGFYFNVHTALSPGGAIRGQLVKVQ